MSLRWGTSQTQTDRELFILLLKRKPLNIYLKTWKTKKCYEYKYINLCNVFYESFSLSLLLKMSWKLHFSSSGRAPPSASFSLFILSYSLVPSISTSSSHIPSPIPPGKDSSELLTESISREDFRQTVCFSAGCFFFPAVLSLRRYLTAAPLSFSSRVSHPALNHAHAHTHTLTSTPVMTAKHRNSDSRINMSTNMGWVYPVRFLMDPSPPYKKNQQKQNTHRPFFESLWTPGRIADCYGTS